MAGGVIAVIATFIWPPLSDLIQNPWLSTAIAAAVQFWALRAALMDRYKSFTITVQQTL